MNQLKSCLVQALKTRDTKLNKNYKKIQKSLEALLNNKEMDKKDEYVNKIIELKNMADTKRENLKDLIDRQKGTSKEFNIDAVKDYERYENEEINLGDIIINILDDKYNFNERDKMYWAKNICEALTEEDELEGVLAILKNREMNSIHSVARKAIQMIDFVNYGPSIRINDMVKGEKGEN